MYDQISGAAESMGESIRRLGPWFHNLHLPGGVQTAPDHPLGDFPASIFAEISPSLPRDLSGWSMLDVGCNAGFYSFEIARRGATVAALDMDPHYLRQARWAAQQLGLQDPIEFRQGQVYDVANDATTYDLVWFMGVFYHLRYPLLALDLLARRTRRLLVFQTMTYPDDATCEVPADFPLHQRSRIAQDGWPKMGFVEHQLARDPTNWWVANPACVEAMLRSSGLRVVQQPSSEVWLCEPDPHTHEAPWIEAEYHAALGERR